MYACLLFRRKLRGLHVFSLSFIRVTRVILRLISISLFCQQPLFQRYVKTNMQLSFKCK